MRFEADAPIAKRSVNWRLLLATTFFLATVAVAADWRFRLVPLFCFLALAAFSVVSTFNGSRKPSKGLHKVVADATGLTIDGVSMMHRAAIVSAYYAPADGDLHAVHIEGRLLRPGCTVYVDSAEHGERLLAALEIDASKAMAHFRALPPWAKHVRWLAVILTASPWVLINVLRHIPAWGVAVIAALYGVIALPTVLPQRIDVGQDGIFLRWLGNKRFIPFAKIEIATANKIGIDLFLRGERHVEIRMTQKDGGAATQVHALLARITEGMAAHRGLSRADEEAFLARGQRDVATWLHEMRALGAGEGGGYRANAIPRERLWAIVENPAADPSAREGAALALSASLEEDDRVRLRATAQKTASPRLRIALDGVGREREETRLRIALETAEREIEETGSGSIPAAKAAELRMRGDG